MSIRTERPEDYESVYSVIKAAFAAAEHSDGTEQDLVNAPPLSGVVEYAREFNLSAE